ncbi:hypothetical protein B5M44_20700 [Shinella sumterensis]|uniref:phage tail protein n=1 Tax=Shinella sumterensis TaxID=1967501 RepID=UPI00106E55E9|nr:phage tail protein [Shinella sumterensis]MCD1265528.1 hypothetical protein [Shinella sumterensis]TFE95789.1 hypothetical protein B5M44_20700 [Shinella sumterensis]
MPPLIPYNRSYSFTSFQADNPSSPLPGIQVDNELENVKQSIVGIVNAINDVRRSDGKLKNEIVTIDSLTPQVRAGIGAGALAAAENAAASAAEAADSESTAAEAAEAAATSAEQANGAREDARFAQEQAEAARTVAQTARDFAAQWASAPENQNVNDGVNPVGKSAYHWAQVALAAAAGSIADGSVTTAKIADGAVTRAKLASAVKDELDGKADGSATTDALAVKVTFIGQGAPLPTSDVGPIWHADYASVMTWQVFNANGAAYTGYASSGIGMPFMDGRSTARTGYLKRNGASLSKTTYAALWAWAQHNGRVVAIGDWAAGAYVFADNGNGTFKLPDNRGEFERLWDDGRGVDTGRTFGSSQLDAVQNATGTLTNALFNNTATTDGVLAFGNSADANLTAGGGQRRQGQLSIDLSRQLRTAAETRGRNVALLACIKF